MSINWKRPFVELKRAMHAFGNWCLLEEVINYKSNAIYVLKDKEDMFEPGSSDKK